MEPEKHFVEVDGKTYEVHLERDEDIYVATVPTLKGCLTDGETPDQTLENIKDAIQAWKEAAEKIMN